MINCKNCDSNLEDNASFCDHCGAKVMKDRITFKFLLIEFFASFGWDSLFFNTLKKMLLSPEIVINEYLNGVRKKYVNPFAFLAVGAALSLLIFSFFKDDFKVIQQSFNSSQIKELHNAANQDIDSLKHLSKKEIKKLTQQKESAEIQLKIQEFWSNLFVDYFNIMTFLFIPFYAFLSKLTFRKPHNFGEHIIINSFIHGTTLNFTLITFSLALVIHPKIYSVTILLNVLYYCYCFKKLYQLTIKQTILKFLRFILILTIIAIILFVVGMAFAIIWGLITKLATP